VTAERHNVRYCSNTCRQLGYRTRNVAAADLLKRQTRAIIDGADPVVLAEIAREARELLGD